LVVWNIFFSRNIGNVTIPTEEGHHFSEGLTVEAPLHISEFLPRSGREPRRAPMRKEKKIWCECMTVEPFWVIWHCCGCFDSSSTNPLVVSVVPIPFLFLFSMCWSFYFHSPGYLFRLFTRQFSCWSPPFGWLNQLNQLNISVFCWFSPCFLSMIIAPFVV
jgi:hypothetical protein